MNRILLTAAAVAFTFVLVTSTDTQANGPKGGTTIHANIQVNKSSPSRNIYRANNFRGWSSYCWFGQQRCYGFYDPIARCWFYWYPPMRCYLPVSYMTMYPPTQFGAPGLGVAPGGVNPGIPGGVNPGIPMGTGTPGTPGGLPQGAGPVTTPPPLPGDDGLPAAPQ